LLIWNVPVKPLRCSTPLMTVDGDVVDRIERRNTVALLERAVLDFWQ
jgi:hypothetical protein